MPTSLFTTVKPPVLSGLTEMFKTAKQRKKEKEEEESEAKARAARIAAEAAAAAAAHEARVNEYRRGIEQHWSGYNPDRRFPLLPVQRDKHGGTRRKPKSHRRKSKTRRRKRKSHRRKH